jgi:hypothetical protein
MNHTAKFWLKLVDCVYRMTLKKHSNWSLEMVEAIPELK